MLDNNHISLYQTKNSDVQENMTADSELPPTSVYERLPHMPEQKKRKNAYSQKNKCLQLYKIRSHSQTSRDVIEMQSGKRLLTPRLVKQQCTSQKRVLQECRVSIMERSHYQWCLPGQGVARVQLTGSAAEVTEPCNAERKRDSGKRKRLNELKVKVEENGKFGEMSEREIINQNVLQVTFFSNKSLGSVRFLFQCL